LGVWPLGRKRETRLRFDREALPHLDAVYRFALSLTHDAAEADDLVQETYLKALRAFESFEEGTHCKAWLFKILRNTHINRIRSRSREVDLDDRMEAVHAASLAGWSERAYPTEPEAAAILAATRDQLAKALAELPADFRTALVLADVEGLAYKEVADIMGTPIGTVMSRLFRGRRMMRERLGKVLFVDRGLAAEGDVVPLFPRRRDGDGHGV
jgi:RNA polymerase sigma-70 factor (ECF subfamily)